MDTMVQLDDHASLKGGKNFARNSKKPVYYFLGIPYAKPPIGKSRFKEPESLERLWTGERIASKFGPICPQNLSLADRSYAPFRVPRNTSEDCLFLNVYTPCVNPSSKMPVMVWIHGGSFIQGFGDFYDGTPLCTFHDVVFVSINYRLGPFGFLCTNDGTVNGNMGLLDQLEALRWIRKYIHAFGGDKDNVTLFGESAGAISIALHILSLRSKGLFKRAISESGTSTHPNVVWTREQGHKYAMARAKTMGFKGSTGSEMINFFNTKSASELVKALGRGFNPVIDGSYLIDEPVKLYSKNIAIPVDFLLGFNNHEGAQFIFETAKSTTVQNRAKAKSMIEFYVKKSFFRGEKYCDEIIQFLFEKYVLTRDDDPLCITQGLVDLYGHLLFMVPTIDAANKHSEISKVFMYEFTQRPPYSPYPDWVAADHGHEIGYVLGEPFNGRMPDLWSETDRQLCRKIMAWWTHFAATGYPGDDWPEYNNKKQQYLQINSQASVKDHWDPDTVNLWTVQIPNIMAHGNTRGVPSANI